jgi:ribonuclease HII
VRLIIGVDEVGRGPLAGPVVAAAVALPEDYQNSAIKDSKKVSARNREALCSIIKQAAAAWSIVAVGHRRIGEINIRNASLLAMRLATERVLRACPEAELILVDGNVLIPFPSPRLSSLPTQRAVVKGDSLHVQISAASIIAKVWRDQQMEVLDRKYPGYSLGDHAGYPTPQHKAAIEEFGPSPIHRQTFSGVREFLPVRRPEFLLGRAPSAKLCPS